MDAAMVLPVSAEAYSAHPMHASERIWTETNCYVDLWIELLHSLGHDPVAAMCTALSADFDGEQWMFLKFPLEDLRVLYGIDVQEMNVWRPVLDHVETQAAAGHLLTVEVDAFFLPDTAGVSYQIAHTKTTIVPNLVDREGKRLGYFHNAGYFELSGEDFDGIFRLGKYDDKTLLYPYVEVVRLGEFDEDHLVDRSVELARAHLARAPKDNPVRRMGEQITRDIAWLTGADLEVFHLYSFGMLRQCGLTAELAADYCTWLSSQGLADLSDAAEQFRAASQIAKSVQFRMARLARGRAVDVSEALEDMATKWDAAMSDLRKWNGD